MSDGPRKVDGSGYTFSGSEKPWEPVTVSIPFEWVAVDENGVSSGPIRGGQIIGGKYDGLHLRSGGGSEA